MRFFECVVYVHDGFEVDVVIKDTKERKRLSFSGSNFRDSTLNKDGIVVFLG